MSNDGQNFDNPVYPSDDTQPQTAMSPAGEVDGAQSRRNFLRTAVISGVAVATVTTSAGVAAAAAQPHTGVLKHFGIVNPFGETSSGAPTCSMCFESTELNGKIDSFNVSDSGNKGWTTQPGSFFIWFTAHNVPNGSYVITISPEPGTSGQPFVYASNGNNAFLYQRAAGQAADCPNYYNSQTKTGALPGDEKRSADTVPDLFVSPPPPSNPGPYVVTGGPVDLQITAHIKWDSTFAPSDETTTYTFTGQILNSSDNSSVCSTSTTVNAVKN